MWWKQNKWKIIVPVLVVVVLAVAFFRGGSMPDGSQTMGETLQQTDSLDHNPVDTIAPENSADPVPEPSPEVTKDPVATAPPENDGTSDGGMTIEPGDVNDGGMTVEPDDSSDGGMAIELPDDVTPNVEVIIPVQPDPVEPEDAPKGDGEYSCTVSIFCGTILDNMDLCDPDKTELVPEDGWILEPVTVSFKEGENVFDALQRACQENKIHLEFAKTPMYNSAYIEGIHNLYEFDVGELSGWMYKVNDWFPNYGCSRYLLKDGDVIGWEFTCELGYDIGGGGVSQADE